MALDTFIAGRYSGAYGPSGSQVDVGITSQGFDVQTDFEMEDIGETDAYGMTVIDGVFRGGQCFMQFESLAYKAGSLAAFWPWGNTVAGTGVFGTLINPGASNTPIGVLASDKAQIITLTATAGTPAASTPATLNATKALIAKNNNGRILFNSTLRKVPVRFRLYPVDAGSSVIKFFTTT